MSENYNGWKNRETWAAMLHLDNDEGLYNEYMEQANQVSYNVHKFERWLEERFSEFEEQVKEGEASVGLISMILDIGSLWRIDYREMAEHICHDWLIDQDLECQIELHYDVYVNKGPLVHSDQFITEFKGTAHEICQKLLTEIDVTKMKLEDFDSDDQFVVLTWGGVSVHLKPVEYDEELEMLEEIEFDDESETHLFLRQLHELLKPHAQKLLKGQ